MKVAFQIGSFIRDAEWAIVTSGREENKERRLLQALAHLQDAGRWVDDLFRLLPRRSKRSKVLSELAHGLKGGAS